ncbi:MAG: ABC-type polysaccharide/polyol phosphate transport system ATPase subunit [Glaciecola sp.]|jgi:ABC-type polysaccharide/polyol phosphate transport system ATPase subunit
MVLDLLSRFGRDAGQRPAIELRAVRETFRLYHERPPGIKERLARGRRSSFSDFNALDGVTLRINPGESVGIIGHNGSGKSTLLKVLAKILPPDGGAVEINGTVASLLELGAGFHGDLSGRENIFLNGAILGLTRAQVKERFEEIVDFAGIREFLDTAVRNYSSGMTVRLGFAIAVHVDPDILLVDEVLAVGDADFQRQSLRKMDEFQEQGKTIVVVSHDLGSIQKFCDRVIVLERGKVVFDGPASEGVQQYAQLAGTAPESVAAATQVGDGRVKVADVQLTDLSGRPIETMLPSTPLRLRVKLEAAEYVEVCSVGAVVHLGEQQLYEVHTTWQGLGVGPLAPGTSATVDFKLNARVLAGHYTIDVVVTDARQRHRHAFAQEVIRFDVQPFPGAAGVVDLDASTSVVDGPAVRLREDLTGTGPIPVIRIETPAQGQPPAQSPSGQLRPDGAQALQAVPNPRDDDA